MRKGSVGGSEGPCTSALRVDGEAEGTASGRAGRPAERSIGFVLFSEPAPAKLAHAHLYYISAHALRCQGSYASISLNQTLQSPDESQCVARSVKATV